MWYYFDGAESEKSGNAQASAEGAIKATFAELLEEQIANYPHKDTYEATTEDLKWTTQHLQWHVTGVTGSLHGIPSKVRTSYTSQAALRGEFLVGLLAAPEAGRLFAVIPPFRPDQLMYVTHFNPHHSITKPREDQATQFSIWRMKKAPIFLHSPISSQFSYLNPSLLTHFLDHKPLPISLLIQFLYLKS